MIIKGNKNMKIKNILITISAIAVINVSAAEESFFSSMTNKASDMFTTAKQKVQDVKLDDIKKVATDTWDKTKETVNDVKESNTTKEVTSSISSTTSKVVKYVKPDENQSVADKTKQIGNEAIEFVKDKYKALVK